MSTERQPKATTAVRLADLTSDTKKVTQLASRRGGVSVVDENGNERFRLSIPKTTIE